MSRYNKAWDEMYDGYQALTEALFVDTCSSDYIAYTDSALYLAYVDGYRDAMDHIDFFYHGNPVSSGEAFRSLPKSVRKRLFKTLKARRKDPR